jgi:hypothetical protein
MTDGDKKIAFELIQQLRGELMLRDEVTRAAFTTPARRKLETACQNLTVLPTIAINTALARLADLNAIIALA